jgi:hypothetical protein
MKESTIRNSFFRTTQNDAGFADNVETWVRNDCLQVLQVCWAKGQIRVSPVASDPYGVVTCVNEHFWSIEKE